MRRELRLVLGARATWGVLAVTAVLVGHSFVLAVDLFSAASGSVGGGALMAREMDPLAGIVRPTLGGLHLAVALLLPVLAARGLAIEKERKSWGALALARGGTAVVVLEKAAAAALTGVLMLVPVLVLLCAYTLTNGPLDLVETSVALFGHLLHVLVVALVSVAAAAGTRSVAQATTLGILLSVGSWATQAGDGFAALAWMSSFEPFSVDRQLASFEQGVLPLGGLLFFVVLGGAALVAASVLARFEPRRTKALRLLGVVFLATLGLALATTTARAYDWSEQRRASLPPAIVLGLRQIPEPIGIELWLDRDDGRRAHVERDAIAKLRLARPDLSVTHPLDGTGSLAVRDAEYGRLVIHVGEHSVETRSTSRRELTTLIFELAERTMPAYEQPVYGGHPHTVSAGARTLLVMLGYLLLPLCFLLAGIWFQRNPRSSP